MANAKNANDLNKIMSEQLDIISKPNSTVEDLKRSDTVANMIGKSLKLAGLQMAYADHRKKGGEKISTLESEG